MLAYALLLVVSITALGFSSRFFASYELKIMWASYALHSVFSAGLVIYMLYIYGGGDMLLYHELGGKIADRIWREPNLFKDLIGLILKSRENELRWTFGAGSSTGTMVGLSTLAHLIVGDSLVGKCLVFANQSKPRWSCYFSSIYSATSDHAEYGLLFGPNQFCLARYSIPLPLQLCLAWQHQT